MSETNVKRDTTADLLDNCCDKNDHGTRDESNHKFRGIFKRSHSASKSKDPLTTTKSDSSTRNEITIDYLTTKQRQRIVTTWRAVEDRRALGRQIYLQIFMHKPSLKSLFPFRNVPADKLSSDTHFGRQGALFADFLHSVVGFVQVNDEKKLREMCKRIGQLHARMTQVNFEPDWWRLFVSSTLDCIQPYYKKGYFFAKFRQSRIEFAQAWSILLGHVVDLMSESFYEIKKLNAAANEAKTNVSPSLLPPLPMKIEPTPSGENALTKLPKPFSSISEQNIIITTRNVDDDDDDNFERIIHPSVSTEM